MKQINEGQAICPYCGWDNSKRKNDGVLLREGTILNAKYLVGRKLGRGGFGVTYLGLELNLNIKVAIKEYFPVNFGTRTLNSRLIRAVSTENDDEACFLKGREAFLKEARTLAMFKSNNIVRVRDLFLENNTAYIVMEYVDGIGLNDEIKRLGRMPWQRVVSLMLPLMLVLDLIHQKNVIHRDIKPENIRINEDKDTGRERLVLLDFGAARSFISAELTGTYSQILSSGYAPFEQYKRRSHQGPYTDVYALCASMYKAITGETPPSSVDIVTGDEKPKSFGYFGLNVPDAVEKTIMHGMAVHIADRIQTMTELYKELSVALEKDKISHSCSDSDHMNNELSFCFHCMEKLAPEQKLCPHCGYDNSKVRQEWESLKPGTILHNKILSGSVIDRDLFGINYIGLDLAERKKVVIKEYFPGSCAKRIENSNEVSVFDCTPCDFQNDLTLVFRRVKKLESFSTPNISGIREFFLSNGTIYIIMDYDDGISIYDEIKNCGGRLPWKRVLRLTMPLMLELEELHKKNLLHLNIKPKNLLLSKGTETESRDEKLRLINIGFKSKIAYPYYSLLPSHIYSFCEPLEMINSKGKPQIYSDVYSLCSVIYFAISGERPPFCTDRLSEEFENLTFSSLGLDVPGAVEKVILHGMALKGIDRPQTMRELFDEFNRALESLSSENGNLNISVEKPADKLPKQENNDETKELSPDDIYKQAVESMKTGFIAYQNAFKLLQKIPNWKDTDKLVADCQQHLNIQFANEENLSNTGSDEFKTVK